MGVNMSYVAMYSATIGVHARAQVLIAIVLLLQWSKNLPEIRTRFQFLDLFAGEAKAYTVWPFEARTYACAKNFTRR